MSEQKSLRTYLRARWNRLKQLKKRSVARGTVTGVLTTGIVTAFGLLSVGGAMMFSPTLGMLVAAFVFGGVAEGEVYFEEIKEGMKDVLLVGRQGKHLLIRKYLNRLLKNKNLTEGSFLSDYEKTRLYLKATKGKALTQQEIKDRAFALARLEMMQDYLLDRVMNNKTKSDFEKEDDTNIINELQKTKRRIKIKMWMMRLALPLGLFSGLGLAIATSGIFSTVFTGASAAIFPAALSGMAALGAVIWPLAVIAGIGAMFLLIHTVKEFLFSNKYAKLRARIRSWFEEEMTLRHVLKVTLNILALVSVVGLCIAAVLLMGDTTWTYMHQGASLLMPLTNALAWVANGLTILYSAGQLVFTLLKSVESVDGISRFLEENSVLKVIYEKTIGRLIALRAKENWLQFFDPFRAIARLVQGVSNAGMLLGHVVASGMGGDRTELMSAKSASIINGVNEFTQDLPFFNKSDDEKTLTSRLVTFLISPLLLISSCWQTAASRFNTEKPKLRFGEAIMNAFELSAPEKLEQPVPAVSEALQNHEITSFFEKEKTRLQNTRLGDKDSKITALNKVKETLKIGQSAQEAQSTSRALNKHRLTLFASNKPTKSSHFVNEMKHRYGAAR